MTSSGSWAILRQVVLGSTDHAADSAAIRQAFRLGDSFADPELDTTGLVDATFPVAKQRYLEVVAPVDGTGPVAKFLQRVGGRGGFALSVQHPDPDAVRARAEARGVRVPIDLIAFGRTVIQLHPKDVGVVLEVDGIDDPAVWFWDEIDPGPGPDAAVDEIVAVDIQVTDPAGMAALWAYLLDIEADGDRLDLGGVQVRFRPGGPSADWTVELRRSGPDATVPELPGISFRLV